MLRLVLAFSLLLAAPASALPVIVYADAATNFGFDPSDVAAAIAAGAAPPALVNGLFGGQGFFSITTPEGIPGVKGKNKEKPSQGTSTWTLHVAPSTPVGLLDDFSLVILGHDPGDPFKYKTKNVGLQVSTALPWRLVTPAGGGPTYLAFELGDLVPGGSYEIPIEYRVAQKLKKKNGEFIFPRYAVAYLSVPEPSALVLLFAATLGFAAARRSR